MTLSEHIRAALPKNFCSQQWLPNGLVEDYANVIAGLLLIPGKIDRTTLESSRTYSEHLIERCQSFGKPISSELLSLLVTEENGGKKLDRLSFALREEARKDPLNIDTIQQLCLQQMQVLLGEEEGKRRLAHLIS